MECKCFGNLCPAKNGGDEFFCVSPYRRNVFQTQYATTHREFPIPQERARFWGEGFEDASLRLQRPGRNRRNPQACRGSSLRAFIPPLKGAGLPARADNAVKAWLVPGGRFQAACPRPWFLSWGPPRPQRVRNEAGRAAGAVAPIRENTISLAAIVARHSPAAVTDSHSGIGSPCLRGGRQKGGKPGHPGICQAGRQFPKEFGAPPSAWSRGGKHQQGKMYRGHACHVGVAW